MRLKSVPGDITRPITDRVKGALFNIISADIVDSRFLDMFGGTGSVGIEALSRGAETAVFIEEFYPAVKTIKLNLARCEAEDRGRVMHKEFNRAVIQLAKEKAGFDLVFLDPPYRLLDERHPLKVIKKRGILNKKGIIILRHFFKTVPDQTHFKLFRAVTIGDDTLSFFR